MAKAKRGDKSRVAVDSIRHKDKRANIPTEELRDFVAEDEKEPKTKLYPRDPSLDPQLVWKGKEEQDAPGPDGESGFSVPVVPVYIQEKIHPQAIIEDLRTQAAKAEAKADGLSAPDMFGDFNGLTDFDKKVDFYHHEQHWSNRMILGDSLLVMTSLAEKEGLKGKVQTIYFDPPYGIKFGSNWQVSTRKRDVKDGKVEDATRQPEQIRAFRDTWRLGIHSYLAYLRDRLVAARELLTETGSVFVQIGDENVHLVRCVMDEVFGSENQVATICFQKTGSTDQSLVPQTIDYLLLYSKNIGSVKYRRLFQERTRGSLALERYDQVLEEDGLLRHVTTAELESGELRGVGVRAQLTSLTSARPLGEGDLREVEHNGVRYAPSSGTFKTDREGMARLLTADRARPAGNTLRYLRCVNDFPVVPINDRWESVQLGTGLIYVVQTSTKVIERAILMTTDPGDLVLDPTCGSGTTAYIAEQWGRRWITIDTSRVALALARTRLMAGRFPYYQLADSEEGIKKEVELTGKVPPPHATGDDIRRGFVYKRVPHVTLKSIANNEEIDAIHAKWTSKMDPVRQKIYKVLKQTWVEWQVPRLPKPNLKDEAKEEAWKPLRKLKIEPDSEAAKLIASFWDLRRERQKEIDASIARNAEIEFLYDQPYEDNRRVRVTGPFTVESLSPHRVLSSDDNMDGTVTETEAKAQQDFTTMILENLRKAGVQNTIKNERLKFDRLETFGGAWIHAVGEYAGADGKSRRVAVSIGPEHGTVGPPQVKEAAKEAVKGVGFDTLIVCGFAFDPHVGEEAKRYGKLTVLTARMNPDLAMGDELLKKTGAGNLFMIFGEPDVEIRRLKDGRIEIEIKGVDVYDPTTGQIRNSTTDDIACWFIDTNYNGESFFVRHAYFTGAEEPYEKLKRALRAEIDEGAWASLYKTSSRPFPKPETGKIAIKVINHYGDEVLKVFEV